MSIVSICSSELLVLLAVCLTVSDKSIVSDKVAISTGISSLVFFLNNLLNTSFLHKKYPNTIPNVKVYNNEEVNITHSFLLVSSGQVLTTSFSASALVTII